MKHDTDPQNRERIKKNNKAEKQEINSNHFSSVLTLSLTFLFVSHSTEKLLACVSCLVWIMYFLKVVLIHHSRKKSEEKKKSLLSLLSHSLFFFRSYF